VCVRDTVALEERVCVLVRRTNTDTVDTVGLGEMVRGDWLTDSVGEDEGDTKDREGLGVYVALCEGVWLAMDPVAEAVR
jgi:hypothetical protein